MHPFDTPPTSVPTRSEGGGALHGCERRFAEAMRLSPPERGEFTLQTTCGMVFGGTVPTPS